MTPHASTTRLRAIWLLVGVPLLCVVIGVALLSHGKIASAQTTSAITGRVVLAATGEPINSVRVSAYDSAGNLIDFELSRRTGHYTLTALPPGDYIIRFDRDKWLNQYYDNQVHFADATPVTVVTDTVTTGIDAALIPRQPTTLVIATTSTRPDAILASRQGSYGPIFTPDGGQQWQPFHTLPYMVYFSPPRVALVPKDDPAQPLRFLLGPTSGIENDTDGIFRSGDAGVSWARFSPVSDPRCDASSPYRIDHLVVSPTDPQRVYAALHCRATVIVVEPFTKEYRTLYTSSDGGVNWQPVTMPLEDESSGTPPLLTLQPSPAAPARLYAQSDDVNRLHWRRSDDHGQTWITEGFTMTALTWDWTEVDTLYGVEDREFPPVLGAPQNALRYTGKRSDDGGATWQAWAEQPCRDSFQQLLALPAADTLLLLCHQGLLRSTDGGDTWTLLTPQTDGTLAVHHGDHEIVLWARGHTLWMSRDQGATWTELEGWRDLHLPSVLRP